MAVRISSQPGRVDEANHYLLLWKEGHAAAAAGLLRDTKYRGFERRCWFEGYDAPDVLPVVNHASDNVRQNVSDNDGQSPQVTDRRMLEKIRAEIAENPDSPRARVLRVIADSAAVFIEDHEAHQ